MRTALSLLFCLFSCPIPVQSGKILFLVVPDSPSHRKTLYPMAEALQSNGHHVTLAAPGLAEPKHLSGKIKEQFFIAKTSDQQLMESFVFGNSSFLGDIQWKFQLNNAFALMFPSYIFNKICLETIDQYRAELKEFMQRNWDLVLVDEIFNSCGTNMASLSPAPYVSVSTTLIFPGTKYFKGVPYNPAITAPVFHKFEFKPDDFWSRVKSILSYYSELFYAFGTANFLTTLSGRRLDPDKYQSFPQFVSNSKMIFTDYPNVLEYPQPTRFDVVQTGSYCRSKPKPLSDQFERFVSDPKSKGTIYMAFGTLVKWTVAPMEKILAFKEAISRLKDYRIFWQYDGPKLELPDHVIAQNWFPQPDILAHKRTIVFLSHGGLKSLREGICERVPTVLLPIFGDQMRNGLIFKAKRIGTVVDKLTLTADSMESALRSVMEDPEMRRNMGKMGDFLRDQLLDGPPLAVFWSEFLIRHQGLPKLFFSSRSQELWLLQYFLLDVIGVFLGFVFFCLWSSCKILKRCYM